MLAAAPCVLPLSLTVTQKDCEAHGQTPPFRLEDVVLRRIEVVSRSRIQLIIDVMGPAN